MRYIKYFNELNEAIINANNYSEKDEPDYYDNMKIKASGKKVKPFKDKVDYIFDIFEKCPIEDFKTKYLPEYKFIMSNYRNSHDLRYMRDALNKFEVELLKQQRIMDLAADKQRKADLAKQKSDFEKEWDRTHTPEYIRKEKEANMRDHDRQYQIIKNTSFYTKDKN